MANRLKIGFYIFTFGLAALLVVITRQPEPEVLGQATNLSLFIEPDDGRRPLLDYIAQSSQILTEVYLLSDPEIIEALASKSAQILLEEHPFGGNGLNQKTKILLGNLINWTNPTYPLTHAKFMVFDNKVVCILNLNLTKTAFTKNREYNICSENQNEVNEARNIFLADWNRGHYTATASSLIVSPDNSRGKLTALMNSAKNTLDIEIEVLTDQRFINLIAEKAKTIPVRIIVPPKKQVANPPILGVQMKILSTPYPHAKLIIADYERAYIGSINLTSQSLDQNRELGIIVSQSDILQRLNTTFALDWEKAVVY